MAEDENKKIDENSEKEEKKNELEEGIVASLNDVDISQEVQNSFLDYAMSVIVSRAIPDVRDGLKPVHRRIVYSMFESNNTPDKPYKKCARIVGDVMGKYHPHGDAAIYDAVVRLAQPFNMRYVLVDGQGNFGNIDGDQAAANRYTEARLAKISLQLVRDIECDTVDFIDNYDGIDQEPVVLPSRFPNILANGSNGIAVGMSTYIPPHNIAEVIDATIAISKNPELSCLEIMQYLKGPDFPTGAIILGKEGIKKAYETGNGVIKVKAKTHFEEKKGDRKLIIIDEIPYGIKKDELVKNIASLARDKKIIGITGIKDESTIKGIRIVIELRHDVIPEVILNQLFKLTQLHISIGINLLCLDKGVPLVMSVNQILNKYLEHQIEVVTRRTKFLLKKDEDRKHIIEGLLIAIDNIDEVVNIIRSSSDSTDASHRLIERFGFSNIQCDTILAMPLRRLTGLEKQKIIDEMNEIIKRIEEYNRLLSSRDNIVAEVTKELLEIKEKFGDPRRTEISEAEGDISDESLIPEQNIVVVITQKGYIKRMTADTFRTQNRGGRGIKGTGLKDDDLIKLLLYTNTHTNLYFFSDKGKVYTMKGYKVPEEKRTSKGIPVLNFLNIEQGENIMAIIDLKEGFEDKGYLTFFTTKGLVKKTAISEFASIRNNGKIAIVLKDGDSLLDVKHTSGDAILSVGTKNGRMVVFNENDVRPMGRASSGVKAINVDGSEVVTANTSLEGNIILTISENGFGKMSELKDYRQTNRGAKGVLTLKTTPKTGKLVATKAVKGDEDLMLITSDGIIIRVSLSQIRVMSRNTQGVKIVKLNNKQKVSSFTILPHSEEVEDASNNGENQESSEKTVENEGKNIEKPVENEENSIEKPVDNKEE